MSDTFLRRLVSRFSGARDPQAEARDRAIEAFRREAVAAIGRGAASELEALRAQPAARGLADDDVELAIEMIDGALDAMRLGGQIAAAGLPVVETQHRAIGADVCHFLAPATLLGDAEHTGRIILTSRRLLFLGGPGLATSWSAIAGAEADGRDLVVRLHDAVRRFRCNSYSEAGRASVIVRTLTGERRTP